MEETNYILLQGNVAFHRALRDLVLANEKPIAVRHHSWPQATYVTIVPAMQLPAFSTEGVSRKVNDRTSRIVGKDIALTVCPYLVLYSAQSGLWQTGWSPSIVELLSTSGWFSYCIGDID